MSDWKSNPIITAFIAGSAVLTTTLFIVFTYVIPVYQKEDHNKIIDLQKNIENKELLINELTNKNNSSVEKKDNEITILNNFKNSEIKKIQSERDSAVEKLDNMQKFLSFSKLSNLYQKGALLPIGYDGISIGDDRESLIKYYGTPRAITDEDYGYISVKYGYGGIDHIVYYFSSRSKNPKDKISHIVVFKENTLTLDKEKRKFLENLSLKDFLINNFGSITPCQERFYIWDLTPKDVVIYYDDKNNDTYEIYGTKSYPSLFNEDCINEHLKAKIKN
ncbi:hypothetical protein [Enterobacter sp. JBIWA005]|uniref:hypothetical protein n=1 Tax=Enterobacter sp. JBIWA005 TaxID=2831891 RepID=UPI001CBF3073|nr:hypothetical protein [Enterobacter sp. JBIWA005]UAN30261.1 hypothetical protein KGP22_13480 [Enterobacter sp. JBIWA005]